MVTHPERVVFPALGVTKLDLVRYYLAVADGALRGVVGRPMILKRFVKGITEEAVFQKRPPAKPAGLDRGRRAALRVRHRRPRRSSSATPRRSPGWSTSAASTSTRTRCGPRTSTTPTSCASTSTRCPASTWAQIVDVALVVRDVLEDHGLVGWPKTSGSRGFHIYARIDAALDVPRAAPRRRDRRPRGRAPGPGPGHEQVVEGGAARRLRRLQPERQGPYGRVGLLGARDCPTPGSRRRWRWDEVRGLPAGGVHARDRAGAVRRASATRGPAWTPTTGSLDAAARRSPRRWDRPRSRPRAPVAAQSTMPLIEIARAKTKQEALDGLDRWKARHPAVVPHARAAPTCSSTGCAGAARSGTGSASTCSTCPRPQRPEQEPLEVDYDPWAGRTWPGRRAGEDGEKGGQQG